MKQILTAKRQIVFYLLAMAFLCVEAQVGMSNFMRQLQELADVSQVTKIESGDFYKEKYVLKIRQYVDGDDASKGTFNQRVIVGLRGLGRPTVLVTEGYSADYALNPRYVEELSRLFDANLVFCEYRYFAQSAPDSAVIPGGDNPMTYWKYMTVDNSLRDLHHVRQTFGQVFRGKWIATGISKGGQTTMFYRATYPEDVDVSVSYVAPLNKRVVDGRHEPFLAKQVGTEAEREQVLHAQQELMKRKERLMPQFEAFTSGNGQTFSRPLADVYDYCVMEFSFALWQWGTPTSSIPSLDADDETWFDFFTTVSSPDYFENPSTYLPFFVQAKRELGYYGYSRKGLKKWQSVKSTRHYLQQLMLPEKLRGIHFDKSLYKRTRKYLKENDPRHIFIYGEIDPWSASGVAGWLDCSKKQNMRVYVQPRGSHRARISNMPDDMKADIMTRLTEWLE